MSKDEKKTRDFKGWEIPAAISGLIVVVAVALISISTFYGKGSAYETSITYNEEYAQVSRDTSLSLDANGDLVITRNRVEDNSADLDDAWTVLVYMTGADLESDLGASTKIMNDIASAKVNVDNIKNLNLLVQTGGAKSWGSDYGSTDNLHRLKLTANGEYEEIEKLPIKSMGDPDTLSDFIEWGMTNYPAQKTMIIFWDHGGSYNDMCYDEIYNEDALTINEVEYAFAKSKTSLKAPIDVALFHTCSNGTVEYANALAPYVDYMIITPTYTPTFGLNYKALMNQMLKSEPEETKPSKICQRVLADFRKFVDGKPLESVGSYALMTYDLRELDPFLVEYNKICKQIYEMSNIDKKTVKKLYKAISKTSQYNMETNFDVACYLDTLQQRLDMDVSKCMELLDKVVVRYIRCNYINDTCLGMAMYHPTDDMSIQEMNLYRNKAVSPYYMMYIERLAHYMGKRDFETFKNYDWSSSKFFYEENFDFLNYSLQRSNNKLSNEEMYKIMAGNQEYLADGFIDCWNDNIKEVPIEQRQIYADIEVAATEDTYTATITGEIDEINRVYNTIYATVNDRIICLGEEASATLDEETGEINSNFNGEWLMLGDGQLLTTYYNSTFKDYEKEDSKEYVEYTIPVYMDDKEAQIYVMKNNDDFEVRYIIQEEREGIKSGYAQELTPGMKFTPIYDVWDEESKTYETEYGEEYTYKGDNDFLYTTLADDKYYYAVVVEDITREKLYSKGQKFSIVNGEIAYAVTE